MRNLESFEVEKFSGVVSQSKKISASYVSRLSHCALLDSGSANPKRCADNLKIQLVRQIKQKNSQKILYRKCNVKVHVLFSFSLPSTD